MNADRHEQLINAAVGKDVVEVSHSLEPCTTTVQSAQCQYRNGDTGQMIMFVDTPAFPRDEGHTPDGFERQLRTWMKDRSVVAFDLADG